MRICAFTHCSNGTYQLEKWKAANCEQHHLKHDLCPCPPPFKLYPFPTQKKKPQQRLQWINAVKRVDPVTKKVWIPKEDDRVCSNHFEDNKMSNMCPNPCINLGHKNDIKKRSASRNRTEPEEKKSRIYSADSIRHGIDWDHRYIYKCDCTNGCVCRGCVRKELKIKSLTHENEVLRARLASVLTDEKFLDICRKFLMKTDEKVKAHKGLQTRTIFEDLYSMVEDIKNAVLEWKE